MKIHAVCINPSRRGIHRLAAVALIALVPVLAARAATLGTVTGIDRKAGELQIDGQAYKIDSFSQVRQTATSGDEEVAAWYSLQQGDYVVFDAENGRITTLRREAADGVDRPAGRPTPLGDSTVQER
jgi:hypothetical protein